MPSKYKARNAAAALENKVVIVTGAAGAIGKLLAERLVACNASVLMVDINPAVEQQAVVLNAQRDKAAAWMACDLCQPQEIRKCIDYAVSHFGCVDVVVNNAGIINTASLFRQPDHTDLERVIRLNLLAPMEGTRVAVKYFQDSGRPGVVLNTASVAGLTPVSFMETYGTSKAGLLFFTAACKELAPHVRVNAVAPYFVDTPLVSASHVLNEHPKLLKLGMLKPERVVESMLRAICDESLAGDTLVIYDGKKDTRLALYDDLALKVTSGIAAGMFGKIFSGIGRITAAIARKLMH